MSFGHAFCFLPYVLSASLVLFSTLLAEFLSPPMSSTHPSVVGLDFASSAKQRYARAWFSIYFSKTHVCLIGDDTTRTLVFEIIFKTKFGLHFI